MSPLLLALSLSAHAASPMGEVRAAFSDGAPSVLLTCSPAGRVAELVRRVPLPADTVAKIQSSEAGFAWDLLDPAHAAAAGLDVEGPLAIALRVEGDKKTGTIVVPFTGGAAQAEALLRHNTDVTPTSTGWTVKGPKSTMDARIDDGRLVIREGSAAAAPVPEALFEGFPDLSGCVAYVNMDEKGKKIVASAFVPLSGGSPLLVHVPVPGAPDLLAPAGATPIGGSSTEPPLFVGVIDVALDDLILKLAAPLKADVTALTTLRSKVRFGAGTTIAAFKDAKQGDVVVVVPVTDPKGRPLAAGKIAKVIRAGAGGLGKVQQTGHTTFDVETSKGLWHLVAQKGRIVVAGSSERLADVLSGKGTPWITDGVRAWQHDWPVAIVGQGAFPVRIGLKSTGERLDAAVSMEGLDPKLMDSMLAMAVGAAIPNFQQTQLKAKRAEVATNLGSLTVAESSYQAAFDACLGLPAAPRAEAALTKDTVPWAAGGDWARVWAPAGPVRGAYWVEASAGACTVFGAIDADGDGVPARYKQVVGGALEQLTPDTVY